MQPHEVKLPLRLGPYEFGLFAAQYRRLGVDVEEAFEIERRTVSAGGLTGTAYIIKGLKGRKNT